MTIMFRLKQLFAWNVTKCTPSVLLPAQTVEGSIDMSIGLTTSQLKAELERREAIEQIEKEIDLSKLNFFIEGQYHGHVIYTNIKANRLTKETIRELWPQIKALTIAKIIKGE